MATPPDFYKIATMADRRAKSCQSQKYYAGGGCNLVWPVSMFGGETTPGSEAFLLPWGSVAGVYVDPRGPIRTTFSSVDVEGDQRQLSVVYVVLPLSLSLSLGDSTAVAHLQLVGRYLPLSYLAPSLDVAVAVARHTSCSFPIKHTP